MILNHQQIGCLINAAIDVGCEVEDVACQCSSSVQVESAASTCVAASCTNEGDVEKVTSAAQAICEQCNTATPAASTVVPITTLVVA